MAFGGRSARTGRPAACSATPRGLTGSGQEVIW